MAGNFSLLYSRKSSNLAHFIHLKSLYAQVGSWFSFGLVFLFSLSSAPFTLRGITFEIPDRKKSKKEALERRQSGQRVRGEAPLWFPIRVNWQPSENNGASRLLLGSSGAVNTSDPGALLTSVHCLLPAFVLEAAVSKCATSSPSFLPRRRVAVKLHLSVSKSQLLETSIDHNCFVKWVVVDFYLPNLTHFPQTTRHSGSRFCLLFFLCCLRPYRTSVDRASRQSRQ